MSEEPRVILQDMPTTVRAFCYHDDEGNPYVVVNSRMPKKIQDEAYQHEMGHIERGEMFDPSYHEYED